MATPALKPRDYQRDAIAAVRDARDRGVRRPAIVLPTGSGKTVVFGHFAAEETAHGVRSLIIAHRDELIRQAVAKVRAIAPHLRVGVVKATENQVQADVIVASEQTLRNARRRDQIRDVGLIVVDECHHATSPSYRAILDHFGSFGDDGPLTLGVTATMMRGDGAALGEIWQDVVYRRGIGEMIRDGYLCGVRGVRVQVVALDLDHVKRSGGDFADGDLGRALEAALAPEAVAKAYAEHCANLQGILFAPTIRTAELFAEALNAAGFITGVVTGSTPKQERTRVLDDFKAGKIQVLSNCAVLTEGTDLPMATVCVVARPTQSAGLYVQMVGRVLRPWPGKDRAIVLDVTGASARHSLVGAIDLFGREDSERAEREEGFDDAAELIDLLDMGTAEAVAVEPELPQWVDGKLKVTEVDLFHGSQSAWQRTYAGAWFIAGEGRYVAIVPALSGAGWSVASISASTFGGSRWIIQGVDDLGYAMAYAEADVTDAEQRLVRRAAGWRSRPVNQAQLAQARRFGILGGEQMSGGELSEAIEMHKASARIDPPLIARGLGAIR